MGRSEPPGEVRGTFEPLSVALSSVESAAGGAKKAESLRPLRLLPGSSLAL